MSQGHASDAIGGHSAGRADATLRRFVVVSGSPASGKSTLGRRLAEALTLEFIDKDDHLERLFDRTMPRDRAEKLRLSRQADASFRSEVEASSGAVVVSFWRRPELGQEFGTPLSGCERSPPAVCARSTVCARLTRRCGDSSPGRGIPATTTSGRRARKPWTGFARTQRWARWAWATRSPWTRVTPSPMRVSMISLQNWL